MDKLKPFFLVLITVNLFVNYAKILSINYIFLIMSLFKVRNKGLKNVFVHTLIMVLTIVNPSVTQTSLSSSEFERLRQIVQKYGFSVILKIPPQTGTYGMLDTKTRTIWINPVVFELRIATPTLVHETVHAVQQCASPSQLKPLGLGLEYPKMAYPHFMRYTGDRRHIEAEAYTVQSRTDSVDYVIGLLAKYCR